MSESEHQESFICSICLDPLKEPVTIPCGHSYCLKCIDDCWGQKKQKPPYRCPQCRESFTQKPLLKKNTLLSEMMEKLEKTSLQAASRSQENPGVVLCDVCTSAEKNRAVMSCLQCLASFCEGHLLPHHQSPVFMKHKLVKATTQVQENVCGRHGKLMEIYCRDDSQCICYLCMIDYHKGHSVVSVEAEWMKKKKVLQRTKLTCTTMIEEREKSQQELDENVKAYKRLAQEAVDSSDMAFTELISFLENKRSEVKDQISQLEKAEMDRAEGLQIQLNEELTELRQRITDIERLLNTEDPVHLLKSFQSVFPAPVFKELPRITQPTHLSFKDISMSAFKEVLEDVNDKISRGVSNVPVAHSPQPTIRSEFWQYFCQLHLDPNTAHNDLLLSEGNVTVFHVYNSQQYPDHPDRFEKYTHVMCKEGLRGRCYWEVECSGADWCVAVTYKGIGRKGASYNCRLGFNKKSWRVGYAGPNFCFIHNKAQVQIPAASRLGVYLDHKAGLLDFYEVCNTMTLLHRVQTTFTEALHPAFGVMGGSSVTILDRERIQRDP